MARFIEEEEEEEQTVSLDAPSSDTEIYVMKSQIGHERTASERLADRVRRSGAPIFSILAPPKLRGFIFVETNSPEALRDNLRGLTHARGMVMNRGKGYGRSKEPDTFGTTSLEELKPHLRHHPQSQVLRKATSSKLSQVRSREKRQEYSVLIRLRKKLQWSYSKLWSQFQLRFEEIT